MIDWFRHMYPYTNVHELNLDWLIDIVKQLNESFDTFVSVHELKFADPLEWDKTTRYEPYTIVISDGLDTYVSKQVVPPGIELNNTDYWLIIGNYNAQIEQMHQDFDRYIEEINNIKSLPADLIVDQPRPTLKRGFERPVVNGISYGVQGCCATDKYIVVSLTSIEEHDLHNMIMVLNQGTYDLANITNNQFVIDFSEQTIPTSSHASSLTYIAEDNEVYMFTLNDSYVIVFDADTFEEKRRFQFIKNANCSYDNYSNTWCVLTYANHDQDIELLIYNKELTLLLNKITTHPLGVTAGCVYSNGFVYIPWDNPSGRFSGYENITVVDINGNVVRSWWFGDSESTQGFEFEDMAMITGNRLVVPTNHFPSGIRLYEFPVIYTDIANNVSSINRRVYTDLMNAPSNSRLTYISEHFDNIGRTKATDQTTVNFDANVWNRVVDMSLSAGTWIVLGHSKLNFTGNGQRLQQKITATGNVSAQFMNGVSNYSIPTNGGGIENVCVFILSGDSTISLDLLSDSTNTGTLTGKMFAVRVK